MKRLNKYLLITLFILVWVPLVYGGWHLKRWFNFEFGYKSDICEMVKTEALVNPAVCKEE